MAVTAAVLLGAFWIALAFAAFAIFALTAPFTGTAGAAAITALVFLLIVVFGGLLISRKIQSARQTALISSLAATGGAQVLFGLAARYPLLTLGIGGAVAAFFLRGHSPTKS